MAKRIELFSNYVLYLNALKQVNDETPFFQWIGGSFVTKKPEPKDIDLVTFIDFKFVERFNEQLSNFKSPTSKINFELDAYIIKTYPADHKYYNLYLSDKVYWLDHFGRTRRNRVGKIWRKGFLEINF